MILHARKRCAVTLALPGARRTGLVLSALLLAAHGAYCTPPGSNAPTPARPASAEASSHALPNPPHALRPPARGAAEAPCSTAHFDIEELNYLGADLVLPTYSDSITGVRNPLRRDMLCHDITYRVVSNDSIAASPQSSPATVPQQIYVGQRPTWAIASYFFLTADLRSIHLAGYQFNGVAVVSRTSWYPATLEASKMMQAVLYKPFLHNRIEIKAGYQNNDDQFVGMQVGGNASSGSEGVFAVPQNEIGLAYAPLSAPSVTVRVQPRGGFYAKGGLQRSASPAGGPEDLHRDAAGFRFVPKGDGLLSMLEGGYKRDAQTDSHATWIRGGYMTNTTRYLSARTNTYTAGNRCWFVLADRQLRSTSIAAPNHGLYAGVSAISVPSDLNAYPSYDELRFYQVAPLRSRPYDMASVVLSHTGYSRFTRAQLTAAGKTTASSLSTAMASYSVHIQSGIYVSGGVAYNTHPAISPNLPGAFTATMQTMFFF
ncbi:MAG: carbohydrate porin [Terracidiphilus sp.]